MKPTATSTPRLPSDLTELLNRLDQELEYLYEDGYRGIVLYGSYARGEADYGSDVDLLLLLDGEVNSARELRRSQSVKWPLALAAGYTVSLTPVSERDYRYSEDPYLWNARREGILHFDGGRGPTR